MAQRVLIAMAISCSPSLVLADEPTSGLDTTVQAAILNDLRRAVTEVGASLLLVTHDFGIVANYCDRLYVMESGEIVEEAIAEDFFAHPAHPAGLALLAQHAGSDITHIACRAQRARAPGIPSVAAYTQGAWPRTPTAAVCTSTR